MKTRKTDSFDLRLSPADKQAFRQAAEIPGLPLSAWVRERLRKAVIGKLENAGRRIPFLSQIYGKGD
jgi:uncharacterized protein (DUF1778 family)